jgi:glycerol kinase
MLIGLSTYTTKHHIARATLEATCFQTRAILEAMAKDTAASSATRGEAKGKEGPAGLKVLQVDGGMTGSDITMQLQADILGIELKRPSMRECVILSPSLPSFFLLLTLSFFRRSTVLGAAMLAGAALGLFGWDLSKPRSLIKVNRLDVSSFKPQITDEEKEWKYAGWVRAVDRARGWKSAFSLPCSLPLLPLHPAPVESAIPTRLSSSPSPPSGPSDDASPTPLSSTTNR